MIAPAQCPIVFTRTGSWMLSRSGILISTITQRLQTDHWSWVRVKVWKREKDPNDAKINTDFWPLLSVGGGRGTQAEDSSQQYAALGFLVRRVAHPEELAWRALEDQPDVLITTTKSTKAEYDAPNREKGAHELDQVLTTVERHGDELVVTTTYPRYSVFAPPLRGGTRFDLMYDIRVPRNARLTVDHDTGYVFVDNLMSDTHVTVLQGSITLRVPPEGQYAIDARSTFGSVSSDFPGRVQRKLWLVGQQFTNAGSSSAKKIYLRVGYGDIILLEPDGTPLASPRAN